MPRQLDLLVLVIVLILFTYTKKMHKYIRLLVLNIGCIIALAIACIRMICLPPVESIPDPIVKFFQITFWICLILYSILLFKFIRNIPSLRAECKADLLMERCSKTDNGLFLIKDYIESKNDKGELEKQLVDEIGLTQKDIDFISSNKEPVVLALADRMFEYKFTKNL